eukprot:m.122682 g.122682  ORF g.122682 m.122682 type:complete len:850 (+) comp37796_c0_seq9:415-2964(+)
MNSTAGGLEPTLIDSREIFYTNLLLLGFNPEENAEKWNVPFNKDMFALPNKKGMEVIVYTLFDILNPELNHEVFRDCWPPYDKKQEQFFRKKATDWFNSLSKDQKDHSLPRVVPSLLMSPGGNRFYMFLVYFSTYVLRQVTLQSCSSRHVSMPQLPRITGENSHLTSLMIKGMACHMARSRKTFLGTLEGHSASQKEWMAYAHQLTKDYRKLCKNLTAREKELAKCRLLRKERALLICNRFHGFPRGKLADSLVDEELQKMRKVKLQKLRHNWKTFQAFCAETSQERRVVQSILDGQANKYSLNAKDVPFQIPDVLLPACQQELQNGRLDNPYRSGKLDLVSLVKIFNLGLKALFDKLKEVPLPGFNTGQEMLAGHVHSHHGQLASLRNMNATLAKTITELNESLSHWQDTHGPQTPVPVSPLTRLGLGLLSDTPGVPPPRLDPSTPSGLEDVSNMRPLKRHSSEEVSVSAIQKLTESVVRGQQRKAFVSSIPVFKAPDLRSKEIAGGKKKSTAAVGSKRTDRKMPRVQKQSMRSSVQSVKTKVGGFKEPAPSQRGQLDSKGYSYLVDQIAAYVSTEGNDDSPGSSDSSFKAPSSKQLPHAIADPTAALGQDGFSSRDKIPRTPAKRWPQTSFIPKSQSPLASYLEPSNTAEKETEKSVLLPPSAFQITSPSPERPLSVTKAETPGNLEFPQPNLTDPQLNADQEASHFDCNQMVSPLHSPVLSDNNEDVVGDLKDSPVISKAVEAVGPYLSSSSTQPSFNDDQSSLDTLAQSGTDDWLNDERLESFLLDNTKESVLLSPSAAAAEVEALQSQVNSLLQESAMDLLSQLSGSPVTLSDLQSEADFQSED